MKITAALALALTLAAPVYAADTADTGGGEDTDTGGGDTDTGEYSDTGVDTDGSDTEVSIPGTSSSELAGEKGGCDSVLPSSAAAVWLVGLGWLARRRRE